MRILLVSQFWPGPADPDLGVFVRDVVAELERRGHTVERAVVDRRGLGAAGHARLLRDALRLAARGPRPDVVFAHFLMPAGWIAALASLVARAPLVVMAHGQDVRNLDRRWVRAVTALALRRARAVVANSAFLRDRLVARVPGVAARTSVIDCGVDLAAFAPRDQAAARARLGLPGALAGPVVAFVGGLTERKNVVRLADAVAAAGGTLLAVGEGEARPALAGRPGVHLAGAVAHDAVADWIAAADVLALPSLEEPLGQVLLEAMAGERSVVATRVGGPPELVPPDAGALVDPHDVAAIRAGIEAAAALGVPNPAARTAAANHAVERQVGRMEALLGSAAVRGPWP